MKIREKGVSVLLIVAIVGTGLVLLAEPLSRWLLGHSSLATAPSTVGHIVRSEGHVRRIHDAHIENVSASTENPLDLHDGDRIETDANGKALIVLQSQDEFQIGPHSIVHLQLWNAQDPATSPIYLQLRHGQLDSVKTGVRGKAYVVKDGRLYLPGQNPTQKPLALTVLHSAALDLSVGGTSPPPEDFDSANLEKPAPRPGSEDDEGQANVTGPPSGLDPETLSNEYIDETIVSRQEQLQKCWLSHLKDDPKGKGQITIQFEISRRGKVKDVRIADSNLSDETLKTCVITVFERLNFRSFKGAEISLAYPLKFE